MRDSSTIKILLCTNSSNTKLFLTWGKNMVLSNTSQECTCTFELTDVHQCIKVDFSCCCFMCLITTSFHSFSTAAFASGINIARSGRSFAHTLERQISRIVWTIRNSRFPNIHTLFVCTPPAFVCTPEIRWVEQHPEFVLLSSQVHTWEYLVLPGFEGYSKNFAHRYAMSRDERQHAPTFT